MPPQEEDFVTWLDSELKARGWSTRELARRAGVSPAAISNVLNRHNRPGKRTCKGVARALETSPEDIFRRAGILPPVPSLDANAEVMLHLFRNLPDDEQERVLTIMRALSTMHATAADDANGSNNQKGE